MHVMDFQGVGRSGHMEMIEQNYKQIWHEIKANIKHSCKL